MATAEIGRGRGLMDTINVYDTKKCAVNCPFQLKGDGKFHCLHHNGDATVEIIGGVTRDTLTEFKRSAPCMRY